MTTPPPPPPGAYPPPPGPPPFRPPVSGGPRPGYYPPPAPPGQRPYPPVYGAPGYPPPMPPRQPAKKSFLATPGGIFLIIFGTVALFGGLLIALFASMGASDRAAARNIDVQVTSCSGTGSTATIGYTVTNSGSQAQRVTLKVEYRDSSGARLDTDTAYVGSVPAGDTVRGEESTALNASPGSGTITCRIVEVS